ncbi:MAG: ABC transporter substrate-binding protein [Bacteroidetes bacterium]|nr:ABC transporter substrate-binding protein [Bacteroidota bacterium]
MIYLDQLGRKVFLDSSPKRIVSLVPSQTEYLYDLGLGERIAGQTIFCIYPENEFKRATKVGGTKKLLLDKIRELKPDIIIANKEENEASQIKELEMEYPVWISDIKTIEGAYGMMKTIGEIFGKEGIASEWIHKIKIKFESLELSKSPRKALYLIWREPWMAAGRDTFINAMLPFAGFENAIQDENSRYPELNLNEMESLNPEFVLLSSEPYPFQEKHIAELKSILPETKVLLVDGEMFSWYGSRLLQAPDYFSQIHKNNF